MLQAGKIDQALTEAIHRANLDSVTGAFAYQSGADMTVPGLGHRQRWRIELTDTDGTKRLLFMKRYTREPFIWRVKKWFTYGAGLSPAEIELENIRAAHAAGVATIPQALAGAQSGRDGPERSYLLMTTVGGEALEQCLSPFLDKHGLDSEKVRGFTRDLASFVRKFHRAGYVHRDLYTSHIFLDQSKDGISLCLIDLARMFAPRWRRFRWLVKDLAQLKYSMPPAWTNMYWSLFMDVYLDGCTTGRRARFARAIDSKVASITRNVQRKRRRKTPRKNT